MKLKKLNIILIYFLAFLLLFNVYLPKVKAAALPAVTFQLSSTNIQPGQSFDLSVNALNITDLYGVSLDLYIDKTALQITGIDKGSEISTFSAIDVTNENPDITSLAAALTSADTGINVSNGTLFVIHAKALKDGTTILKTISDNIANELSPTGTNICLKLASSDFSNPRISYTVSDFNINVKIITNSSYTVTYDNNGGTGTTPAVIKSIYDSTITLPTQGDLSKTGYNFSGWNSSSSGIGGTHYDAGASYTIGAENVTMYAEWTETNASKAIGDFVIRLYQQCLNRDPDSEGLNYWKNQLLSKVNTGAGLSYSFIFSTEFIARNVSDDVFIDIMYRTFFDRVGDSGGKAYWMDKLANGISRLYVLSCFVNSAEFNIVCNNYGINRGNIQLTKPADLYPAVTAFTNRFYVMCMGRTADDSGLNYWVNQLITGQSTGADISQGFIFSPEFTSKNLSNTDFTAVMYRVFFNREPDSGGQAYWVNALQSGKSRYDVLKGFVNSQEFAAICSNYGIKVGVVK